MRLTIEVTQQDIRDGVRSVPERCAITLAARRVFGPDKVDGTYFDEVYDEDGEEDGTKVRIHLVDGRMITLPVVACRFIRNFDHRPKEEVAPVSFEVDVPDEE